MKKLVGIALFIFWAVVVSILTAGLIVYDKGNKSADKQSFDQNSGLIEKKPGIENLTLSKEEIAKHDKKEDCWLLIDNKVYSVASYINEHPGGASKIISFCGKDAKQAFEGLPHSSFAADLLKKFFIGDLNQSISVQSVSNSAQSQANTQNSQGGKGTEREREKEFEDD